MFATTIKRHLPELTLMQPNKNHVFQQSLEKIDALILKFNTSI